LTIHTHTIDKRKHREFLKEERRDPYSHNLIKAGDEVVFCAGKCQCAFLLASWEAIGGRHCEQTQTLKEFPQTHKNVNFKRKSVPQNRPAPSSRSTSRSPPHSRRFLHLPGKVLLFLFIFILFTGFLITLEKQEIVNTPIENFIPSEPVMIVTGAGVKLRKNSRWNSKSIDTLQIGTIIRPLETRYIKGEDWYQVTTPTYKKGWIPDRYTMLINFNKREQAYLEVAKKKLNGKASYGDLIDLRNFLNRVSNEVTNAKIAKELKQLHSLTLQRLKMSSSAQRVEREKISPTPQSTLGKRARDRADARYGKLSSPSPRKWWKIVCQTMNEVYNQEAAKTKTTKRQDKRQIRQKVFNGTIDIIYQDERKKRKGWSRNKIKNKLSTVCK